MKYVRTLAKVLLGTDFILSMFATLTTLVLFYWFAPYDSRPHGIELLVALGIGVVFGHLPDTDMVHYTFILWGKRTVLMIVGLLGIVAAPVGFHLFVWLLAKLGAQGPTWVTVASAAWVLQVIAMAYFASFALAYVPWIAKLVRERASHWPVFHHPLIFVPVAVALLGVTSYVAFPRHIAFYGTLGFLALTLHFLHDGIQKQGFPYLSPFSQEHYIWALLWFMPVLEYVPRDFYQDQADRYYGRGKYERASGSHDDVDRRTKRITKTRVKFWLAVAGSLAIMFFILW